MACSILSDQQLKLPKQGRFVLHRKGISDGWGCNFAHSATPRQHPKPKILSLKASSARAYYKSTRICLSSIFPKALLFVNCRLKLPCPAYLENASNELNFTPPFHTITMSSLHAYLPAFKGIAIAGSLINGGTMTSGYRLLPAIYDVVPKSPKDAANQWAYFYWSMSATVPWVDLTTIIVIGTIAYTEFKENRAGLPWKIWATAAGIMPIGWVWVRKVMLVPSNQLLAIAKDGNDENQPLKSTPEQTLGLLKKFNAQMSFRMMFPWVVGGLALWATLGF